MTVSVPVVDSAAFVSDSDAVSGPFVITGASLVPVTVTTTVRLVVPPLLSVARTVYVSVRLSPAAR